MALPDKNVLGAVEPATKEGFAKLIARANTAAAEGFTLIGVVNIGTDLLGGVYVRLRRAPAANSLVDEGFME
jgi:hypothetical protein